MPKFTFDPDGNSATLKLAQHVSLRLIVFKNHSEKVWEIDLGEMEGGIPYIEKKIFIKTPSVVDLKRESDVQIMDVYTNPDRSIGLHRYQIQIPLTGGELLVDYCIDFRSGSNQVIDLSGVYIGQGQFKRISL